ncbi:MAG TPA: ribosomal protein L7/L12 [Actinocrinis sp.]|nr:ribosomal protein L7/L12 [Actinocrinis sp.]
MDSHDAERLARLEYQVGRLYQHLGLNPDPADAPPAPFGGAPVPAFGAAPQPGYGDPSAVYGQQPAPGVFPPSFAEALRRGRQIEAIKIYREVTGVGLKEAKDAVEMIVRNGGV